MAPALYEGAGIFTVALCGSEIMFAPETDGVSLAATLVPALVAGTAAFAYRLRNPVADPA